MTTHPRLKIRDLRARGVHVPLRLPLQTRGGTIGVAPLALIDLITDEAIGYYQGASDAFRRGALRRPGRLIPRPVE